VTYHPERKRLELDDEVEWRRRKDGEWMSNPSNVLLSLL